MSASNRKKGERFAKLPHELMKHAAVTTLPHAAFRVLAVFAAGYTGDNNGALCATDRWMKQFGINSRDTTYSSIHMLVDRGLIEMTRPGIKQRKVATLYAITWQAVNYRDGVLLGRFSPASHAYKQWKAPERLKKAVPDCRRNTPPDSTEFQSDGRTSISPIVGLQNAVSSPISPTKTGGFQSDGREYSRILAGLPDPISASPSCAPPVAPSKNSAAAKIEKLARLQSDLSDADISKISGESVDLVRAIRASLERQQ